MPPKRKGKEKVKKRKRQNRKRREKKEEKRKEQSPVAGPAPRDSPGPSTSYDTGVIAALTNGLSDLSINQTSSSPVKVAQAFEDETPVSTSEYNDGTDRMEVDEAVFSTPEQSREYMTT